MPRNQFEDISEFTWTTLEDANTYGISQGEETLTDNILLYLARHPSANLKLLKTPKYLESQMGTDWEWWIGNASSGYKRYAVQAKRLDIETLRYGKLKHPLSPPAPKLWQHEVLAQYSQTNRAIPLYALYNFLHLPDFTEYWSCGLPIDKLQLGITITSLANVEHAINNRGQRSFETLHSKVGTYPLRCLLCRRPCQPTPVAGPSSTAEHVTHDGSQSASYSANQLSFLFKGKSDEIAYFPPELYSAQLGDTGLKSYPKRVALLETEA